MFREARRTLAHNQGDTRESGSSPVLSINFNGGIAIKGLSSRNIPLPWFVSGLTQFLAVTVPIPFLDRQNSGPAAVLLEGRSSQSVGGTANNATCKPVSQIIYE